MALQFLTRIGLSSARGDVMKIFAPHSVARLGVASTAECGKETTCDLQQRFPGFPKGPYDTPCGTVAAVSARGQTRGSILSTVRFPQTNEPYAHWLCEYRKTGWDQQGAPSIDVPCRFVDAFDLNSHRTNHPCLIKSLVRQQTRCEIIRSAHRSDRQVYICPKLENRRPTLPKGPREACMAS